MKSSTILLFCLAACEVEEVAMPDTPASTVVHHRILCRDTDGEVVVDTRDVDAPPRTGANYWQWETGDGHSRSVSVPPLMCFHESWKGEHNAGSLIPSDPPLSPEPEPEPPAPTTWEKEDPYEPPKN